MLRMLIIAVGIAALTLSPWSGCRSTYYAAMESFGVHKRDILVDRVEDARADQEEVKETFKTALERFSEVVKQPESDLRPKYDALSAELQRCESQASTLSDRIDSIETVSKDLFAEWEKELDQYKSDDLRRSSERQLQTTRTRYDELIEAMQRAEGKVEPVLASFRDHVLFLKHNLNAQAIASLQGELASLEDETASLISEMEAAIAEADAFIHDMRSNEG
jgi:DNA repair exonuclease SbcCD ATPase subunit